MHGDTCPLDCADSGQVIHTDAAVSKKASVSNLKCFCRRNQCNWRATPTTAVNALYCAAESQCPNPAEYFDPGNDPSVELECYDPHGKQIVGNAFAKRQSWKSPAEQDQRSNIDFVGSQFHFFVENFVFGQNLIFGPRFTFGQIFNFEPQCLMKSSI